MDDQVLDDEGASEAASFPRAQTVPVLGRLYHGKKSLLPVPDSEDSILD